MSTKRLKDLPQSEARDLLISAQEKGLSALGGHMNFNAEVIWLLGLADIVSDLKARIEELEKK